MKKNETTSKRVYFRPPVAFIILEITDFKIPLLSMTAKAIPTSRMNKIMAMTMILPSAANTSKGAVNHRQTG